MGSAAGIAIGVLSGLAALFSLLTWFKSGKSGVPDTKELLSEMGTLLRNESDRIRKDQEEQSRNLRIETGEILQKNHLSNMTMIREIGDSLNGQIRQLGELLDQGVRTIEEKTVAMGGKLDSDVDRMEKGAASNRESLRVLLESKLDAGRSTQEEGARNLREEVAARFAQYGAGQTEKLEQFGVHQKERLDNMLAALTRLSEKNEKQMEDLRLTVEGRLDVIRTENGQKLDEMRKTVDEKLQTTLETKLGDSFRRVSEQLERVHKGIGEMQSLATGVGDLKKVLTNVRTRGTFGEVQLEMLLEQFLSPEQYMKNVQIKAGTQERVEFAVRLPGRGVEEEVLLPVDAKFPQEDYERLLQAADSGDAEGLAKASKNLEDQIRSFAKSISEKYIMSPRTTDFAILFLPTEGLFSEVLRRPGLFERLQRDYHITLTGPTTLTAFLNALQMGFRSLAIEKRSSEVWQILGAVRQEFEKYNTVVDRLAKQLGTAAESVSRLGIRTRKMNSVLKGVEKLPEDRSALLLGMSSSLPEEGDDEEGQPEDHGSSG